MKKTKLKFIIYLYIQKFQQQNINNILKFTLNLDLQYGHQMVNT
jgi:hypothetical protein